MAEMLVRALPACAAVGWLYLAVSVAAQPQDLVDQMSAGGVAILFRHPGTEESQRDTDPKNLDNIAAQRQLTEAGRAQARSVGAQLRRLGVPIVAVLASRYWR